MEMTAYQKEQLEALKNFDFASIGIGMNLPLKLEPTWFASPIKLPARKSGSVQVKHRKVTESTPVIGQRQALMRGVRSAFGPPMSVCTQPGCSATQIAWRASSETDFSAAFTDALLTR